jgi:hypothetical protein
MKLGACLGLLSPAALMLAACGSVEDSSFEFALMGDNPYFQENVSKFETLIEDVNRRSDLAWVLHVGDIKTGTEPCSDELLNSRFALYQRFNAPFVFTPGDNDWFDCPTCGSSSFPTRAGPPVVARWRWSPRVGQTSLASL